MIVITTKSAGIVCDSSICVRLCAHDMSATFYRILRMKQFDHVNCYMRCYETFTIKFLTSVVNNHKYIDCTFVAFINDLQHAHKEIVIIHPYQLYGNNDVLLMIRFGMNKSTRSVTTIPHASEYIAKLPWFAMLAVVVGIIVVSRSAYFLQRCADIYSFSLHEDLCLLRVLHRVIMNGTLFYMLSRDNKMELMLDYERPELCKLSNGEVTRVFWRDSVCMATKEPEIEESSSKLNYIRVTGCSLCTGALACQAAQSLPSALAYTEGILNGIAAICNAIIGTWYHITCCVEPKTTKIHCQESK